MTAGQQRKGHRSLHLAAAFGLIAYVYAPGGRHLNNPVRQMVVPLLVLTGLDVAGRSDPTTAKDPQAKARSNRPSDPAGAAERGKERLS
jgi:hypothetical protein